MITQPHRDYAIVDEQGLATRDAMQPWIESISKLVNLLDIAEGAGSPQGVHYADKKKLYFNTTGSAGTTLYFKTTTLDANTGWVAIG